VIEKLNQTKQEKSQTEILLKLEELKKKTCSDETIKSLQTLIKGKPETCSTDHIIPISLICLILPYRVGQWDWDLQTKDRQLQANLEHRIENVKREQNTQSDITQLWPRYFLKVQRFEQHKR
jgi:C4-dicarboxylate-specific signal transduction histidine kinase